MMRCPISFSLSFCMRFRQPEGYRTSYSMRSLLILLAAVALTCLSDCRRFDKADPPSPEMAECLARFKSIPEIAHFQKAASKAPESPVSDGRPLEGMELALTLNGTIASHMDPQADEDDLCYTENTPENFHKLLDALRRTEMPPTVAFVIGRYLDAELQQEWLASGNLLGNMTFNARAAAKGSPEKFIADIERLEAAMSPLWGRFAPVRKYFRYPELKTPRDTESRVQILGYLQKAGYIVVPATIYAHDDKFNIAYCVSVARNERSCANLTKAYFNSILLDTALKARTAARNLTGADSKQILMLWADQLTCDNLEEIIKSFKRMGARFIALDEALRDPIYTTPGEDGDCVAMSVIRTVKSQQEGAE